MELPDCCKDTSQDHELFRRLRDPKQRNLGMLQGDSKGHPTEIGAAELTNDLGSGIGEVHGLDCLMCNATWTKAPP